MSLLARARCIRTVSRQAVRDNGSARDNGVKAAVLCSTDPGDGWIEKIRLDRRRGSFSASAEPYQSDPEGISAASPERTEIDWRLDITDPTSGCDGPVDNRRHAPRPACSHKARHDASVRSGAARHGTEGKPKDDACHDVDPRSQRSPDAAGDDAIRGEGGLIRHPPGPCA